MATQPEKRQILDMNAYRPDRDGGEAQARPGLLDRRHANYGAASVLFFQKPIEMVSARGCWMEAVDGTRYLDVYNNVPSVGHCHPAVVEAVATQMARLNTNTRYLNEGLERYVERLKATFPAELSNLALSCTGSEANDLALRIAFAATGRRGVIVTETAYHGNGYLTTEVSPSSYKRTAPPDSTIVVPAPSAETFGDDIAWGFARAVAQAAAELEARGHGVAAFLFDSIFSSDGVFADPPGFLAAAVDAARKAGAVIIADEVQPGFGRTGAGLWGFSRHGITPDMVTMGKPMGNGFPMAGTAVRPDLLARFAEEFGYFNTFGGNPVAAAAGNAVLDVIETEGLIAHADSIGKTLRTGLSGIAADDGRIADIRGAGLFIGVDLGRDGAPDPALATALIEALRARRVMIGACGRYGHTLKVRPPLAMTGDDAAFFLDAFRAALASIPGG